MGLNHGMGTELRVRHPPTHSLGEGFPGLPRALLLRLPSEGWVGSEALPGPPGIRFPDGRPPVRHHGRTPRAAGLGATRGPSLSLSLQWAQAQRALPHPELAVMSAETPGC